MVDDQERVVLRMPAYQRLFFPSMAGPVCCFTLWRVAVMAGDLMRAKALDGDDLAGLAMLFFAAWIFATMAIEPFLMRIVLDSSGVRRFVWFPLLGTREEFAAWDKVTLVKVGKGRSGGRFPAEIHAGSARVDINLVCNRELAMPIVLQKVALDRMVDV